MEEAERGPNGCLYWGVTLLCLSGLCLGGGALAWAIFVSPQFGLATGSVWACAGVNVRGQFRIGYAWAYHLEGIVPLQAVMSHFICGYFPRPAFVPAYGSRVYAPLEAYDHN